jgi:GrpB-like predicted nucleotidyltransferase (UPF0157 family)
MYGMNKKELRLLPHDPTWKDDFLAEKKRIENVLQDSSVRIEHIGSTSIPTVHAKPILDLAVLCDEQTHESVIRALTELGYEYRGTFDDESGHFYAVLDKNNLRLCQTHIYTEPNSDWHCKLHFRNVLSVNYELAREYDEYKLGLAKVAADKSEYAEIKTRWLDDFIEKVLKESGKKITQMENVEILC